MSIQDSATELWGVLDPEGAILWSRGGSSTARKLMVYSSKGAAERALKSPWIKQIIPDTSAVTIGLIYKTEGSESRVG